jgi:dipeptidyl-peptidase-4
MKVFTLRSMAAVAVTTAVLWTPLGAQDRLKTMPGYDQYQKMSREIPGSVKLGSISAQWKDDSSSFEYTFDGKRYRFDVAAKQAAVIGDAPAGAVGQFAGRGRGAQGSAQPARGRQFDSADSPDKKLKAFYKDRNLWLSAADGGNAIALTTDGCE